MAPADSTRHRRWYGRDAAPLPVQVITAGPLSVMVEGVDVRRVTYAGTPIMDRIFVAIRDVDWGTLPAILEGPPEVTRDPSTGAIELGFDALHTDGSIRFAWHGRIRVGPDATVSMAMDGVAEASFRYARMGICALLPARSMAGRPIRSSGVKPPADGILPELIAPQLIVDGSDVPIVAAFRELDVSLPDLVVEQRFEGDDFELEDQRNWTDDSFKAYSLMAGEPYPRAARAGQSFRQRVTLTVSPRVAGTAPMVPLVGRVVEVAAPASDTVVVRLAQEMPRWPAMGLGDTTDDLGLGAAEVRALARLRLDHVRMDVHPGHHGWHDRLRRGVADARALGAGLELALSLDEAAMAHLRQIPDLLTVIAVRRVLVLHAPTQATASTPPGWLTRARRALGDSLPEARWISGTDGDFAELNRDRIMPDGVDAPDGLCYAFDPQIHASDEMSMSETLAAQGTTVLTAASWFPAGDLCVSPVTLRQRFNPASATPEIAAPAGTDLPPTSLPMGVDTRQRSLFGAAWTLGSIAALTAAGATSVTWYQTAGWRGLLEWTQPPGRPGWGHVVAGEIYPTYHVFADLGDRAGFVPVQCSVSRDRDVAALAMRSPRGMRVLLANLTPRAVRARIDGLPVGTAESRALDDTTPVTSTGGSLDERIRDGGPISDGTFTIDLAPFAYARVDVTT